MPLTRSTLHVTLVGALAASTSSAQTLVRTVNGPAANAQLGKACIVVADQNADGFKDLLVGAPGFNASRGAVYCLSGAYLASGLGAQTVWSLIPNNVFPGDRFGETIAVLGNAIGNGAPDFVVGIPGYDQPGKTDVGGVEIIDGSSLSANGVCFGTFAGEAFGSSLAACGDMNGDGVSDVAIGSPGISLVGVYDGSFLALPGSPNTQAYVWRVGFGTGLGTAVASGFDYDGDGRQEVFASATSTMSVSGGVIFLFQFNSTTGIGYTQVYSSSVFNERLGASLDLADDFDGDALPDLVVGVPNAPGINNTQPGRALVLSGGRLVANSGAPEIYSLAPFSNSTVPVTIHFGASVRACADLNHDGVGEFMVGAPDYSTVSPFAPGRGYVSLYSGASGARLSVISGSNNDKLGDGLGGALNDYDGDGFAEFAVAGSLSDAGGADSGVVKVYRLFPLAPSTYCTGKLNSLGCTPTIAFSGSPSASSGAPFTISATNFVNQKNGLLFYSGLPTSAPFQGGFKCVRNPTVRTPPQGSGGSTSGSDCTGSYAFNFNAWIVNGWDSSLAAGNEVFAQYWSRDPASASHTGLSNAIRFVINP